jgi:hypothetical protein
MTEPPAPRHLGSPAMRVTGSADGGAFGLVRRKTARSARLACSLDGVDPPNAALQTAALDSPTIERHCAMLSTTRPSEQEVRLP